jgi:hypothetical protein
VTRAPVHLVVPGPLDQRTGGYLYDARMVREMRQRGRSVVVHELAGAFPAGDEEARSSLATALASVSDGETVVVDGLAGGGLPDVLAAHATRLRASSPWSTTRSRTRRGWTPGGRLVRGFGASGPRRLPGRGRNEPLHGGAIWRTSGSHPTGSGSPSRVPRRAGRAVGPEVGAPPRLLSVASVTPRKGHDVLVEALALVADLPWSCVFAGSEALRSGSCPIDTCACLPEAVSTTASPSSGELDTETLDEYYRASTLFVLASHYEGYGMALTEAIVRGLPVVSTTGGAIPYTVPEGAGVLVPPGDAEALSQALRSLLTDDAADWRHCARALRTRRRGCPIGRRPRSCSKRRSTRWLPPRRRRRLLHDRPRPGRPSSPGSVFEADWLTLREAVDHRSRRRGADRAAPTGVAGPGVEPDRRPREWHRVERTLPRTAAPWGRSRGPSWITMRLTCGRRAFPSRPVRRCVVTGDLAREGLSALTKADLCVATALLDLVSQAWLDQVDRSLRRTERGAHCSP